ncbi:MAG TPA: helix-turn-helix domain-containing protein [Solirubrobacterales bacterium]|nr:helix-turn-helix domain-containing protein [Solirubrobacterales bacterium]
MDRDLLEAWLEQGRSLTEIGALVDRDPTTVSYWLKKHGLKANGHDKHAAKGALAREELEPLVEAGLTLEEIGARLRRGDRTIRYWIDAHGLPKPRDRRRGATRAELRASGNHRTMLCKQHGPTEFADLMATGGVSGAASRRSSSDAAR